MKKAAILILALLIAFVLVGCNVAPNVPGVTPYTNTRVSPYPNTNTRVSPYVTAPGNLPGYGTGNTYGYDYNTVNRGAVNNNLRNGTYNRMAPGAR
jgi:hypothetical protein